MIEIAQVHASLDEAGDEDACLAVGRRAAKRALRCKDSQIKAIELHRKSIDARKKRDVHFILSFRVELTSPRLEQEALDSVAERDRSRIRMVDGEVPSLPCLQCAQGASHRCRRRLRRPLCRPHPCRSRP